MSDTARVIPAYTSALGFVLNLCESCNVDLVDQARLPDGAEFKDGFHDALTFGFIRPMHYPYAAAYPAFEITPGATEYVIEHHGMPIDHLGTFYFYPLDDDTYEVTQRPIKIRDLSGMTTDEILDHYLG